MVKVNENHSASISQKMGDENQKICSWHGHLIHLINLLFQSLYSSSIGKIVNLVSKIFDCPTISENPQKIDRNRLIKEAEKLCKSEENAYNFVLRRKIQQTAGLFHGDLGRFEMMLGDRPEMFVSDQACLFLSEIEKLKSFLDGENEILDNELKLEEISAHIQLVFERVVSFYETKVKPASQLLEKGSSDRKYFVKLCKVFVKHVEDRKKVLKNPLSDPYLKSLQTRKLEAFKKFNALKQ